MAIPESEVEASDIDLNIIYKMLLRIVVFKSRFIVLITEIINGLTYYSVTTGVTKTANYTILSTDPPIYVDSSAGSFTLYLIDSPSAGKRVSIIDEAGSCGAYPVTIDGNGVNIIGYTDASMNINNMSYEFEFTGSQWNII